MLEKINELGIGPQGFGGRTTAIGLDIETMPTHIAGMPCAININCHVMRQFAGDKFEKRRAEIKEQYGDISVFLEKHSFYNAVNVFYLKETARWSYIVKNAGSNDIAVILDQGMSDIEADNTSLKGTLAQNLYATLGAPTGGMTVHCRIPV